MYTTTQEWWPSTKLWGGMSANCTTGQIQLVARTSHTIFDIISPCLPRSSPLPSFIDLHCHTSLDWISLTHERWSSAKLWGGMSANCTTGQILLRVARTSHIIFDIISPCLPRTSPLPSFIDLHCHTSLDWISLTHERWPSTKLWGGMSANCTRGQILSPLCSTQPEHLLAF